MVRTQETKGLSRGRGSPKNYLKTEGGEAGEKRSRKKTTSSETGSHRGEQCQVATVSGAYQLAREESLNPVG